ncbi:non-specific lipid transfer protein GPI-anchored 10 [Nicotiana tomentosiformis]|uniref:non-specific lipid transfer protein GPI-anchored 10 n=1 Tax=Nicotiana tomentosiformis TaxID=4098 RepID=UPI00051BD75C|nr:protein YLS3 [Nicotiana tomentosiformis]
MAFSNFLPAYPTTTVLIFSLLFVLVRTTFSQTFGNLPTGPTVSSCGPLLLQLVPCGPFVQGASPSPVDQCCSNLRQLYNQQPGCLCLLLNQTSLSSLPINTTLALQLPLLCNMHVDRSTCSVSEGLAPNAPTPQVSFGTKNNSTVAASPMQTVAPKTTSILGFGFHNSSAFAVNFNAKESLMITVLTSWGALLWL